MYSARGSSVRSDSERRGARRPWARGGRGPQMSRSLSQIQESGGGGAGGRARGGIAGSVLRRRTAARFFSIVACGRGAAR